MKVKGLDGRVHNWNLSGHVPLGSEQTGSAGHKRARELLEKLFPLDRRLEEVILPGTGSLRADFYLPAKNLICEIHGRQHYQYVQHFHLTPLGFIKHMKRDKDKVAFCDLNSIFYCEMPDDESDEQWQKRIFAQAVNG